MADPVPTLRADARRNREKLLHAATEQFAAHGADVALETVARAAGVGIGTLYRHFPTRDDLVQAAYREELDQLCAAGPELLAERPPDEALAVWMERFVDYIAVKRGMAGALRPVTTARTQLLETIAPLLEAGVVAGTIRSDVGADDVLRSMGAIWTLPDGDGFPRQAATIVRLLADGLRRV